MPHCCYKPRSCVPARYQQFGVICYLFACYLQTLNQLLTEIDGFQPTQGVVFMAATNRAALLDPALMRAGRFDRKITIPRPDAEARLAILKVHAKKHKLADDVDLTQLARDVPGLVGADLANLLNEAALSAVREQANIITEKHVQVGRSPCACMHTCMHSFVLCCDGNACHLSMRRRLCVELSCM
jgi:SpoVK/Ycf46/Vps4 family AAA+-type ATPase